MTRVLVQSLSDYNFAQVLTAEGHSVVADEPEDDGGNGLGPTPYELLTWALGACTSMTLQMYARRKKYPLHEVVVQVEFERVHAKDSDPESGGSRRLERMHRKIVLRGPLDDAQKADLLRVAARCPVHKTLMAQPEIVDSLEVV